MRDALTRWTNRPTTRAPATRPAERPVSKDAARSSDLSAAADSGASGGPLDRDRIDMLRSLDDGDGQLLAELTTQFSEQSHAARAAIAQAGDRHDVDSPQERRSARGGRDSLGARREDEHLETRSVIRV